MFQLILFMPLVFQFATGSKVYSMEECAVIIGQIDDEIFYNARLLTNLFMEKSFQVSKSFNELYEIDHIGCTKFCSIKAYLVSRINDPYKYLGITENPYYLLAQSVNNLYSKPSSHLNSAQRLEVITLALIPDVSKLYLEKLIKYVNDNCKPKLPSRYCFPPQKINLTKILAIINYSVSTEISRKILNNKNLIIYLSDMPIDDSTWAYFYDNIRASSPAFNKMLSGRQRLIPLEKSCFKTDSSIPVSIYHHAAETFTSESRAPKVFIKNKELVTNSKYFLFKRVSLEQRPRGSEEPNLTFDRIKITTYSCMLKGNISDISEDAKYINHYLNLNKIVCSCPHSSMLTKRLKSKIVQFYSHDFTNTCATVTIKLLKKIFKNEEDLFEIEKTYNFLKSGDFEASPQTLFPNNIYLFINRYGQGMDELNMAASLYKAGSPLFLWYCVINGISVLETPPDLETLVKDLKTKFMEKQRVIVDPSDFLNVQDYFDSFPLDGLEMVQEVNEKNFTIFIGNLLSIEKPWCSFEYYKNRNSDSRTPFTSYYNFLWKILKKQIINAYDWDTKKRSTQAVISILESLPEFEPAAVDCFHIPKSFYSKAVIVPSLTNFIDLVEDDYVLGLENSLSHLRFLFKQFPKLDSSHLSLKYSKIHILTQIFLAMHYAHHIFKFKSDNDFLLDSFQPKILEFAVLAAYDSLFKLKYYFQCDGGRLEALNLLNIEMKDVSGTITRSNISMLLSTLEGKKLHDLKVYLKLVGRRNLV